MMSKFTFWLLAAMLMLVSCKTSKEAVSQQFHQQHEQIVRDSVIIERHRVDSVFRRDSVFVSQMHRNDTVIIEKHHYHYIRVKEKEEKKDSAVTSEVIKEEKKEKSEEKVVEKIRNPWGAFRFCVFTFAVTAIIILILRARR